MGDLITENGYVIKGSGHLSSMFINCQKNDPSAEYCLSRPKSVYGVVLTKT